MAEIDKNSLPNYCTKCSICKQLNPSPRKKFFINCYQWFFGTLVLIAFILTIIVIMLLGWIWIGNQKASSGMNFSNYQELSKIQISHKFHEMEIMEDDDYDSDNLEIKIINTNGFVFVSHQLNFTDASKYCQKQGWNLFITHSIKEEEKLQFALNSLDKTHFKNCKTNFIGLRRIISEEWKTDKDEPIFGENLSTIRSLPVKRNCVAMIKEHNYAISNVECKLNDPLTTACYICESSMKNCSNNFKMCFKLFIDFVHSINEANERCQGEMSGSKLASIVNFSLFQDIVRAYRLDDPNSICSIIFLGMRSNWIYESDVEERVLYDSDRLNLLTTSNDYCLSVGRESNQWNSADCREKMCFICHK